MNLDYIRLPFSYYLSCSIATLGIGSFAAAIDWLVTTIHIHPRTYTLLHSFWLCTFSFVRLSVCVIVVACCFCNRCCCCCCRHCHCHCNSCCCCYFVGLYIRLHFSEKMQRRKSKKKVIERSKRWNILFENNRIETRAKRKKRNERKRRRRKSGWHAVVLQACMQQEHRQQIKLPNGSNGTK